jgi:hypothetical protein
VATLGLLKLLLQLFQDFHGQLAPAADSVSLQHKQQLIQRVALLLRGADSTVVVSRLPKVSYFAASGSLSPVADTSKAVVESPGRFVFVPVTTIGPISASCRAEEDADVFLRCARSSPGLWSTIRRSQ